MRAGERKTSILVILTYYLSLFLQNIAQAQLSGLQVLLSKRLINPALFNGAPYIKISILSSNTTQCIPIGREKNCYWTQAIQVYKLGYTHSDHWTYSLNSYDEPFLRWLLLHNLWSVAESEIIPRTAHSAL